MTLLALNGVELADVRRALSDPSNLTVGFGDGSGYWASVSMIATSIAEHRNYGAVLGLLRHLVADGRARQHPSGGLYFKPARSA